MDMIEQTGTTNTPETEKKYQPSGWLNNYARLPASPCNQRFLPSYFFLAVLLGLPVRTGLWASPLTGPGVITCGLTQRPLWVTANAHTLLKNTAGAVHAPSSLSHVMQTSWLSAPFWCSKPSDSSGKNTEASMLTPLLSLRFIRSAQPNFPLCLRH